MFCNIRGLSENVKCLGWMKLPLDEGKNLGLLFQGDGRCYLNTLYVNGS